jgi:hypothetical protein
MNEIIERMARVIDPLAFTSWTVPPRGLETTPRHIVDGERLRRQKKAERTARAALLAAREPTEDMIVAGGEAVFACKPTRALEPSYAQAAWPAMIDEVLKASDVPVNKQSTTEEK